MTTDSRQAQPTGIAAGDLVSERFRIVRLLGKGGMGEVYEADLVLHREHVALKTLSAVAAADQRAIERLKREIALARRVTHPNVCRVFDVDQHRTSSGELVTFFTMELLEGDTLAVRLRRHGSLTPADAIPLIRQIAAGLGAAHAAGIVHGDFKPGNVMLVPPADQTSGDERLVVTDFSLAHPARMGTTTAPTMTASPGWGTPAYMSPEQIAGESLTPQTDLYAMGAVVHEMITGRLPFGSRALFQTALDARWRSAIYKCLERDPAARFGTAEEFVRALEGKDTQPPAKASWKTVGLAAAAAVAVVAAVVGWLSPTVKNAIVGRVPALARVLTPAQRSVAFLPFAHSPQTPDSEAFGEGVAVALTEQLRLALGLQRGDDRLWVLPAAEVIDAGLTTAGGARAPRRQPGRRRPAQGELEKGLELSPDVLSYNNLSWVYVFQNRFADAVPPMEEAVRLPGATSFHWGNLARVYRWVNRPAQAKATYETALRMARQEVAVNPRNAKIRSNLAQLLAETGQRGEALSELTSTLERAPSDMRVVFTSALVHELTGDRAAALQALETAARGGHSVAEIRRHPDLARPPRRSEVSGDSESDSLPSLAVNYAAGGPEDMAPHHPVKLKFNDAGEIETEPRRVVVAPGDTIGWRGDEGDVVVTFDDTPVDGKKFSAAKGKQTDLANVRLDAPRGKRFDCTASIEGRPSKVYGVDIEP